MSVRLALIDDDEDDLEFLRSALQEADKDSVVSTFTDAVTARDRLEGMEANNLPDVIVVDHQMPKMPGIELICWIRSLDRMKKCAVVMYSTDTSHISPELERSLDFKAITKVNSFERLRAIADELVLMGIQVSKRTGCRAGKSS